MPELSPYQEDGAAFLAGHRRCGLWDEPGMGKSAQVVRALDLMGITENIMVICPAIARGVWPYEFKLWQRIQRRILPAKDVADLVAWQKGRRDVIVLSYEQAKKWAKQIRAGGLIDALVCDEAHYMRNPEAGRTTAIIGEKLDRVGGIAGMAGTLWWLTGTVQNNDIVDSHTFLRSVDATPLSRGDYIKRYFYTFPGSYSNRQEIRPEMRAEVQLIHRLHSIQRTLEQVGYQLPPLRIASVELEGDTKEITALLRQHPELEKAIHEAVERGGLQHLYADNMATLRKLVGEAKAIPTAKLALDELQGGRHKLIIMGLHVAALQHVQTYLREHDIDARLIYGATPDKDRLRHVHDFQTDPACRVMVANIKTAGTALTLTAAHDLLMMEADWNPANNLQAIKRSHRRGQTVPVLARFVVLADSIDQVVMRVLADKNQRIDDLGLSPTIHTPRPDDF